VYGPGVTNPGPVDGDVLQCQRLQRKHRARFRCPEQRRRILVQEEAFALRLRAPLSSLPRHTPLRAYRSSNESRGSLLAFRSSAVFANGIIPPT
jgi:hypothetical protein